MFRICFCLKKIAKLKPTKEKENASIKYKVIIHNSKNSGMARSEQLSLNWLLSDCVNSNMKRHQRSTSVAGMPLDLVYDPR